jgi:nucleoside-diphosphate-sugar epimerase
MTTLVLGASGATGKQLVQHLLEMEQKVKIIVRPSAHIPDSWNNNDNLLMIKANVSEVSVQGMAKHVEDCQAVALCLGHNLTLKGIYGKPRKLVTNAVWLLCDAIKLNSPGKPTKVVLMNTAGNRNKDVNEPISLGQKVMLSLIRAVLPPQPDNEKAADYLRVNVGSNDPWIEWVVVRPDTLIDEDQITRYELHASPTRSAIFNPGKTSRINVGHFMAQLVLDNELWSTWKGKMPVIYNQS